MAVLKNVHLLEGIAKQSDLVKMEHAALQHKRYSNIEFKIVDVGNKEVIIQVSQGKSAAENYADKKRLIEIVKETFGRFFEGYRIKTHPIPYKVPDCEIVDAAWINKQMLRYGIKAKDIAADTGLDRTNITTIISGDRPLSQIMKALFWYYFLAVRDPG